MEETKKTTDRSFWESIPLPVRWSWLCTLLAGVGFGLILNNNHTDSVVRWLLVGGFTVATGLGLWAIGVVIRNRAQNDARRTIRKLEGERRSARSEAPELLRVATRLTHAIAAHEEAQAALEKFGGPEVVDGVPNPDKQELIDKLRSASGARGFQESDLVTKVQALLLRTFTDEVSGEPVSVESVRILVGGLLSEMPTEVREALIGRILDAETLAKMTLAGSKDAVLTAPPAPAAAPSGPAEVVVSPSGGGESGPAS